jgi:3-oxoacyl-[acyl-carrier protein] reductase
MSGFEGKVALVTGAGRGLGRGFAEHLASLGCNVGVHGRREGGPSEYGEGTTLTATAEEIARTHGVETVRVIGDLTVPEDVERIVSEVIERFGRVDILVHNAGGNIRAGTEPGHPDPDDAIDISIDDVQAVLGNNLMSTILINKCVAKGMRERKSGKIVNISSTAGSATDGRPMYSTSKAGVNHWTKMLAQQMRPFNVTVNALSPGPTRSGRWLANTNSDANTLVSEGTLDRIGTLEDVSRVMEFFSGRLSDFVTGETPTRCSACTHTSYAAARVADSLLAICCWLSAAAAAAAAAAA